MKGLDSTLPADSLFCLAKMAIDEGDGVRSRRSGQTPSRLLDTAADFFRWCREVGFRRTEVIPLAGPASTRVAYK